MFNEICINEEMLPKYTYVYIYIHRERERVSKVGDLSRGWPEGYLFNSCHTEV